MAPSLLLGQVGPSASQSALLRYHAEEATHLDRLSLLLKTSLRFYRPLSGPG